MESSEASSSISSSSLSVDYKIYTVVTSPGYESAPLLSLDLLPWDVVVEPARPQIIAISKVIVDGNAIDISKYEDSILWSIGPSATSSEIIELKGNEQSFQIDKTGVRDYTVSITIDDAVYTKSFKMAVKYVRREIRTLTEADRQQFFAALSSMYSVGETEGKASWGDKFNTAEYYVYKHLVSSLSVSNLTIALFIFTNY
jgi:hypothetical protein